MGEHFRLELGAQGVEHDHLELSRVCEELEVAQLWQGLQFCHDLVLNPSPREDPETTRKILHGSVLDALEGSGVAAAACWQIMR